MYARESAKSGLCGVKGTQLKTYYTLETRKGISKVPLRNALDFADHDFSPFIIMPSVMLISENYFLEGASHF
jgi:hypothetical protein